MASTAVKGDKTLAELAQQFDVHPNQITQWKGQPVEAAAGSIRSPRAQNRLGRGRDLRKTRAAGSNRGYPSLVVEELRRHRIHRAEEILSVEVRLTDQTFIADREDGRPLRPKTLTHEFTRTLARASDVPRIRFLDLRTPMPHICTQSADCAIG